METKLLTTKDKDIRIAAEILKNGGNVIFPTETVYGLGADARNPEAVKNIFKAKGRPSDNPLIVHISSIDMLNDIAEDISESAKALMNMYWPGPLTIIFKKRENVPCETTAGLFTVAVRMPSSEAARRLIETSGIPIAAPSANLSGKPSPTSAKHCIDDMMGRVDAIIEGEDCEVGLESTVVDLSGDIPVMLRPGGVTLEQLCGVLGEVQTVTSVKEGEAPKSPGLKYKHYAPNAEVVILSGRFEDAEKYIKDSAKTKKVGVLVFDEFPQFEGVQTVSLGSIKSPSDAAHRLFGALRQMDECGVDIIFAPEIPKDGMWMAVQNRLYRAAGEKIMDLKNAEKKKVLFVCTGNTCRSPMAEAIFNDMAENEEIAFCAESAGIFADGSSVSENSAEVMKELGVDISGRKSRQVTAEMIDEAEYVFALTGSHRDILNVMFGKTDKITTLAEFVGLYADIPDPYGGDIEDYRKCRNMIKDMIIKLVEKLKS